LNVAGYYDGLLALCDNAVTEGFLRADHRALILDDSRAVSLLEKMNNFQPPVVEKWIGKDDL
jgi:hypothetical protein